MKLSPTKKRWLIAVAKLAVLGLLAWGMHVTLSKAFAELGRPEFKEHLWNMQAGWLVLAGVAYLVGSLPTAYFSYRLLAAMQQPVRRRPCSGRFTFLNWANMYLARRW